MKNRWTHIQYSTICVLGLLIASVPVSAGSFRDFILAEEASSIQRSVDISSDSESVACMQCHDGTNAKDVSIKHADTAMLFTSHGSSNHPVGMLYDNYARKSPTSYVARASLDSRIKLENGKVTCISCHTTRKNKLHNESVALSGNIDAVTSSCSSSKALTTGSSQTSLCMSCHVM